MKIIAGFILCISLISCERFSAPNEAVPDNQIHLRNEILPLPDSAFTINNITHVNIGWVAVRLDDSSNVNINVADSGMYSAHISASPASCTIKGQMLVSGNPAWVRINEHVKIHALWISNVVVVDQDEVN